MSDWKALYVHIPKTGGTSILTAPWIIAHGSFEKSPEIPTKDLNLKLSFTFVRNPYTKFVSAVLNHKYATSKTFVKFVKGEFLGSYKEKFATWGTPGVTWMELQPQYRFVYHNKIRDVDFVGRFEKMNKGWERVCEYAEEEFSLPHLNKGKYQNHMDFYTPETIKIINEVYAKDFELFGYKLL
jgi:hypothetical protein